jgi:hypothetical protein
MVRSSAARRERLRPAIRELVAPPHELTKECKQLLAQVRRTCPNLLPGERLKPGAVGAEVPLATDVVNRLIKVAAASDGDPVVWVQAGCELAIETGGIDVAVHPGLVLVTIPVRCDQVGRAEVLVPFAVGSDQRPSGLVAATEARPRGPNLVVDLWGEQLTAFAWSTFLRVLAAVAAEAGVDLDGAGLIPVAVVAGDDDVRVLTMARHQFDRVSR